MMRWIALLPPYGMIGGMRWRNPKLNRQSSHPDHRCCDLNDAEEVLRSVVALGRQASEGLKLVEAAFDAVADFVDDGIVRDQRLARAA